MKITKRLAAARYTATKIIPELKDQLNVGGIDYSTALTGLAVTAAGGNEILYAGTSRSGHVGSLKRVGREIYDRYDTNEFLIDDVGELSAFGGRGVKVKCHKNPARTMFREPEYDRLQEVIYLESPYCREGEYERLMETTCGLLLLKGLNEKLENTYDESTGKFFPSSGSDYLQSLVADYEAEPSLAAVHLMRDFERSGLLD